MKKKSILIVLALLMIAIMLFAKSSIFLSESTLPLNKIAGSFSIDTDDLNQVVGDADYVFVAKVNNEIETLYKNKVTLETESGSKEVSDPYTKYSITVIDNIKGNLKKNSEINVLKAGGINEDKKSITLYNDDELLQVGKYHIMSAYAQRDGSILVSGPNSSTILSETSKSEIVSSKKYKEYKKAFKNEVKTNRKRFKSFYEDAE